jgi:hypothetical protein
MQMVASGLGYVILATNPTSAASSVLQVVVVAPGCRFLEFFDLTSVTVAAGESPITRAKVIAAGTSGFSVAYEVNYGAATYATAYGPHFCD